MTTNPQRQAGTCTVATCTGGIEKFSSSTATTPCELSSILALLPDGAGLIDCHAKPSWPWAECIHVGACGIAGSL